jgi:hypothetical protein
MWTEVTTLPTPFAADGRTHQVSIEGLQRSDGTWAGRIVFRDGANVRRTEQETSQPNRDALEYWATGLEKVYLEGAFQRSR